MGGGSSCSGVQRGARTCLVLTPGPPAAHVWGTPSTFATSPHPVPNNSTRSDHGARPGSGTGRALPRGRSKAKGSSDGAGVLGVEHQGLEAHGNQGPGPWEGHAGHGPQTCVPGCVSIHPPRGTAHRVTGRSEARLTTCVWCSGRWVTEATPERVQVGVRERPLGIAGRKDVAFGV